MSQDMKKQFRYELITINLKVGIIFLHFISLVQLVNIFHTLLFRRAQIRQFPNGVYFALYVILFVLSCCYLIKAYYLKNKIKQQLAKVEILAASFLILILFWATTVTILDLRQSDNIITHVYCMIAVAVTMYVNPKVFIPILFADYLYFLTCYTLFQPVPKYNATNVAHATTIFFVCIIIACYHYYEKIISFQQNQTIIKQNKVIQDRNAELKKLAVTDTLSGLYNRRLLHDALTDKWEECVEQNVYFSFFMIDIDNFKNINDTYGHLCGDACIAKIADIIRECTEDMNAMSFRYGGEEFAILISHQDEEKTFAIAEQIRLKVENTPIICPEEGEVIYITVSIGVCCDIPQKDRNYFEYISMADTALRLAKQNGKNRVDTCEWNQDENVMYE